MRSIRRGKQNLSFVFLVSITLSFCFFSFSCSSDRPPLQGKFSIVSGPYAGSTLTFTGNHFEMGLKNGQRVVGNIDHLKNKQFQTVPLVTSDTNAMSMGSLEGAPWYGLQVLEKTNTGDPKSLRGPVFDFYPKSESGSFEAEVLFWTREPDGSEQLKPIGRMVIKPVGSPAP